MNCSDKTRRTLGEALRTANLSPEAKAFLSPGSPEPLAKPCSPAIPVPSIPVTPSAPTPAPEFAPPSRVLESQPAPLPGTGALVSMTFRVPAEIPSALVRASAERKVRRQRPFTQQEIVAEAVQQWLRSNGFLA